MTSLCYLIVCVNLLYSFHQAEFSPTTKTLNTWKKEHELTLNSITATNQYEYLAKTLSAYYYLKYDEQLRMKEQRCRYIINKIVRVSNRSPNMLKYTILRIVPAPVTKAYRNKDFFSVGRGFDGNQTIVGCMIGFMKPQMTFSVRPTNITTIKESHKRISQVYEDFIKTSPVPASIESRDHGHWFSLLVRSNQAGDVMACVSVKPQGYNYTTIRDQKQLLSDYFYRHLPEISLYHRLCPKFGEMNDASRINLLYGFPHLLETLKGFKFRITLDSIFPNNIWGVELLHDAIVRTADLTPNTTVIDICSSSGTNSIMMSKLVEVSFALDYFSQSIIEAEYYAKSNNVHNIKFMLGDLNENLKFVLASMNTSGDIVPILNHRRAGIDLDIVKTIRSSSKISRLVYVTYKPNCPLATRNYIYLCSENDSINPPFILRKVIPVDVLPQTAYFNLVLEFVREPAGQKVLK